MINAILSLTLQYYAYLFNRMVNTMENPFVWKLWLSVTYMGPDHTQTIAKSGVSVASRVLIHMPTTVSLIPKQLDDHPLMFNIND